MRATTLSACWQKRSSKNPGAKIIHDPRLSRNTVDVVTAAGGTPVMSKTGHAFIKERMRKGRRYLRWRNERPPLLP
ncbi:hypothetical protein DMI65_11115 [Escherichia coli]|nr:hypothetical protein [Escherichia coli]